MQELTINQCIEDFETQGIERPCGDGEVISIENSLEKNYES